MDNSIEIQYQDLPQFFINVPYQEWIELKALVKMLKEKITKICDTEVKEFLSPKEVCELMKIGRSTYEQWILDGKIPTTDTNPNGIRRKRKVARKDLAQIIANQKINNLLEDGTNGRKVKY